MVVKKGTKRGPYKGSRAWWAKKRAEEEQKRKKFEESLKMLKEYDGKN